MSHPDPTKTYDDEMCTCGCPASMHIDGEEHCASCVECKEFEAKEEECPACLSKVGHKCILHDMTGEEVHKIIAGVDFTETLQKLHSDWSKREPMDEDEAPEREHERVEWSPNDEANYQHIIK